MRMKFDNISRTMKAYVLLVALGSCAWALCFITGNMETFLEVSMPFIFMFNSDLILIMVFLGPLYFGFVFSPLLMLGTWTRIGKMKIGAYIRWGWAGTYSLFILIIIFWLMILWAFNDPPEDF